MKFAASRKRTVSGILVSALILILVFVGVSTATYAWYSAINRAIGDSITFTSSTNDETGGDLIIGWTKGGNSGHLTFNQPNSSLYPMIPKTQPTIGTTTYNEFTQSNFNYSSQSFDNEIHAWICSFTGQNTFPYICSGSEGEDLYNYFFLTNRKTTEKQTITVRYTISGELAPYLRLALFIGDTTTDISNPEHDIAGLKLYGILSTTDTIHYSAIKERDIVADTPVMDDVYRASGTVSFLMNENSTKSIALIAWLDGVMLTNEEMDKTTTFDITFDGIVGDVP